MLIRFSGNVIIFLESWVLLVNPITIKIMHELDSGMRVKYK